MNDQTHQQVGAVLATIDEITPEPPPLPASPARQPAGRRPLPVAVGAFALVLVVVGMVALAIRAPANDSNDAVATTGTSPATVTTGHQATLPRRTLDLPGWNIVGINDSDLTTATIFAKHSTEETPEQVAIVISSDGPNDPPGTRYEEAVASNVDAEHLGTVPIDDGFSPDVFRFGDEHPNYEFIWQNTETVMVQVAVLGVGYEEAKAIVAAVTPITEETWTELVAQFPQTEMVTTTMAPDTPGIRESETPDMTTTTMP